MKWLLISSLILLLIGFGLDWSNITPIIKRIATSSFVLASGGYCVLFLAVCYWWIDMKKHRNHLLFFNLFALNSIFIYLFFEIVGDRWFTGYILTITNGIFGIGTCSSLLSPQFWDPWLFLPWKPGFYIFFTGKKYFSNFNHRVPMIPSSSPLNSASPRKRPMAE